MAKDKNTLTIRWAADGSDKDLKDALALYADAEGGESGRAKRLLRRALGVPETTDKPLDESTLRRVLREELSRVRLAGGPVQEQPAGGMRGAAEEA